MNDRSPKLDSLIGQVVANEYKIAELIGVGPHGCVYKAVGKTTGKLFLLSILCPEVVGNLQSQDLSQYRKCSDTNVSFLVRDFRVGPSLREMIEETGSPGVEKSLHFTIQTCEVASIARHLSILLEINTSNAILTNDRNDLDFIKIKDNYELPVDLN